MSAVGYAKVPQWGYHRFDPTSVRYTNIPLRWTPKEPEPKPEEPEDPKQEDAEEGADGTGERTYFQAPSTSVTYY